MPLPRTRSLVATEGMGETAVRPFSPAGVGGKTLRLHSTCIHMEMQNVEYMLLS